MKLEQMLLAAGAAFALGAAAQAQQVHDVPVFEFDVERIALHDDTNIAGIYRRLVTEAGEYCGDIVARDSVEYPVCLQAMVTHVVDELAHAPLSRLHDASMHTGQQRQQAVAYNAG